MNTILLLIIFSNSTFVMLGKNILSSKMLKLSWIIGLIDILVIYFFFKFDESIILYVVFTLMIVISSLAFKTFVNNNSLENKYRDDNRRRFVNFFVYFLLFFLIMLTIGVTKHLLFDPPTDQSLSL